MNRLVNLLTTQSQNKLGNIPLPRRAVSFGSFIRMKRGVGRVKTYAMRTRREGELKHLSTYAKIPFYHTLLCKAMTFIAVLKSTCYDYFPVSPIFYSLAPHELSYWIFESFPMRNGGLDGKVYVGNGGGVVASVRVCMLGEGGQIFATLVGTY